MQQVRPQRDAHIFRHLRHVAVSTAGWLGNDGIDQVELAQLVGGQSHGFSRVGGLVGAFPQDRRTAFRRDHRVGAVLQHQYPVADADRQRATGTALADHHADHRYPQPAHLEQVAGDGLALSTLLGADAGIGPRRVDEGQYRQPEALGQLHQSQRLAIAFRARHAEVAVNLLLGVAPFLMADHQYRLAVQPRQPADDGMIVGEGAVAVQFLKVGEQSFHIVQGVRP